MAFTFSKLKSVFTVGAALGGCVLAPKLSIFNKSKYDDQGAIDFTDFHNNIVHDLSYVRLFSVNEHRDLPNEVAFHLNTKLGKLQVVSEHTDNDSKLSFNESIRSKHVYIFCQFPKQQTVNDTLVDLFLAIGAARRANAGKIFVVMPYFAYQRQTDVNHRTRRSYFASDLAGMLESLGVDKVITVNSQFQQMHGFFNIPVLEIDANMLCHAYFRDYNLDDIAIVGTNDKLFDKTVSIREQFFDDGKDSSIGFFAKKPHKADGFSYVGESVKGKQVIILDNIVDTGNTLVDCVDQLHNMGAKEIYGFAVHGVLSGDAHSLIEHSYLKEVVMTNTLPTHIENETEKINHVSVGHMIAEAIAQNSFNKSLEQLRKQGII